MTTFHLKKLTALLLLVAVLWAPLHSAYGYAPATGAGHQLSCCLDGEDGSCPEPGPDHENHSCDHDECCSVAETDAPIIVIPAPPARRLSWRDVPVYLPNVFLPIFVPPES